MLVWKEAPKRVLLLTKPIEQVGRNARKLFT